jgi:Esterase-like activity of phytase
MIRLLSTAMVVLVLGISTFSFSPIAPTPPDPGISLIGKGEIGGALLDKSGLAGNICQAGTPANCVPKAILGGFGSDLTYTGHDNVYIAAPDRGPFDGLTDTPYIDRFHFLHITTDPGAPFPNIHTTLLDSRLLKNELGRPFVGATSAFAANEIETLRLDPEGIRVSPAGTFYISDEYGPYIFEFDRQGHLLRRIELSSKYAVANQNADAKLELLNNVAGRQANRGMEGLAISPDGTTLFGMMQNALIQDHGLVPGSTDRLGLNNRIVKINLLTGETSEYVYVLDAINRGQGTCEIVAVNDHQFLVLERDNRSNLQTPPQAPTRKKIYKIDLTGATDVSNVASLPAGSLPAEIIPVAKTLFIDLLDPAFNLAPTIPEKLEGLSFGPDLPDGRHLLYVISDNDLNPTLATQIYAFAIDPSLLDYQPQVLPGPLFPPGQVKKMVNE